MATTKAHGSVAYFKTSAEILKAAKAAREKGFKDFDTFTPFPIHGMDEAIGLKPSIVPWATFFCGLTGFALAAHLQIWTSAYDWPINVGGKPMISGPAFIPILFELTVLLGGLGTAAFMLILNGLPNLKPNPFDPRITDDRFALYIPYAGNSAADVDSFLGGLHAEKVTQVTGEI